MQASQTGRHGFPLTSSADHRPCRLLVPPGRRGAACARPRRRTGCGRPPRPRGHSRQRGAVSRHAGGRRPPRAGAPAVARHPAGCAAAPAGRGPLPRPPRPRLQDRRALRRGAALRHAACRLQGPSPRAARRPDLRQPGAVGLARRLPRRGARDLQLAAAIGSAQGAGRSAATAGPARAAQAGRRPGARRHRRAAASQQGCGSADPGVLAACAGPRGAGHPRRGPGGEGAEAAGRGSSGYPLPWLPRRRRRGAGGHGPVRLPLARGGPAAGGAGGDARGAAHRGHTHERAAAAVVGRAGDARAAGGRHRAGHGLAGEHPRSAPARAWPGAVTRRL